jgi:hypothetical protein
LSGSSETWLGELPVNARLVMGSENLRLLFTNDRILVVHGGKRGAGAVTGTSILGGLGGALESLFKGGREAISRESPKDMTPSQVLRSNTNNFAIGYPEVVSVNVKQTTMLTSITILTSIDKFEFSCRSRFEEIVRIFKNTLPEKLAVQRLG